MQTHIIFAIRDAIDSLRRTTNALHGMQVTTRPDLALAYLKDIRSARGAAQRIEELLAVDSPDRAATLQVLDAISDASAVIGAWQEAMPLMQTVADEVAAVVTAHGLKTLATNMDGDRVEASVVVSDADIAALRAAATAAKARIDAALAA